MCAVEICENLKEKYCHNLSRNTGILQRNSIEDAFANIERYLFAVKMTMVTNAFSRIGTFATVLMLFKCLYIALSC